MREENTEEDGWRWCEEGWGIKGEELLQEVYSTVTEAVTTCNSKLDSNDTF